MAEEYPNAFTHSSTNLLATTPERTFWEKATILHQEAFRPNESKMPLRYSRHYYDLYCLCQSDVKKTALQNSQLLDDVARFKTKFYPRNWARYDLAKFGTIKLLPASHSLERLKEDYESMKTMIYGNKPTIDEILSTIAKLESEINHIYN